MAYNVYLYSNMRGMAKILQAFLLISVVTLATLQPVGAQDFLGYGNSNYGGLQALEVNPASIVDGRYRVEIGLYGTVGFTNDYLGLKRSAFGNLGDAFGFREKDPLGNAIYEEYWTENWRDNTAKQLFSSGNVSLGFILSLGPKSAFAFTTRARAILSASNVNSYLMKAFLEEFELAPGSEAATLIYGNPIFSDNANAQMISFAEYGLSYGHTILDKGRHFLKGAGRVKYLQGIASTTATADELGVIIKNADTLTALPGTNFSLSYSDNFNFSELISSFQQEAKPSVGFDVGMIYEFRPRYMDYRYRTDGKTSKTVPGEPKYLLRVGVSLTDIGQLTFKQNVFSGNFAVIDTSDLVNFTSEDFEEFKNKLVDGLVSNNDSVGTYKLKLPTALGIQLDWHVYRKWFLGFSMRQQLEANSPFRAQEPSRYVFTPRYESNALEVALPIGFDNLGNNTIGTLMRVGPVMLGSNSLISTALLNDGDIYSLDVFFGIKIGLKYKLAPDRDKDGVSNRYDKDDNNPGTWEHLGVPDTDGDHVPDNLDKCPTEPGLPENNGCPEGQTPTPTGDIGGVR